MAEEKCVGFPIATLHCLITMIENDRLLVRIHRWRTDMDEDGLIQKIRKTEAHRANILRSLQIETSRVLDLQSAISSMLPE